MRTLRQPFERRVRRVALVAVPAAVVAAAAAALRSPHLMAESETAHGTGLWLGALAGVAMLLAVYVLPVLLFALALGAPTPRRLLALVTLAPPAALMGILPFIAAIIGGWGGVEPIAVVTAAVLGAVDCAVFVAAMRMRRGARAHAVT